MLSIACNGKHSLRLSTKSPNLICIAILVTTNTDDKNPFIALVFRVYKLFFKNMGGRSVLARFFYKFIGFHFLPFRRGGPPMKLNGRIDVKSIIPEESYESNVEFPCFFDGKIRRSRMRENGFYSCFLCILNCCGIYPPTREK